MGAIYKNGKTYGGAAGFASMVSAVDTEGLIGSAGSEANVQALIDEIADRVIDKLLTKASFNQTIADYLKKEDASKLYLEEYKYEDDIRGDAVNLIANIGVSQTINGIAFTVNDDGSVTVNGTATGLAALNLFTNVAYKAGSYILSGCPSGGGSSTYEVLMNTGSVIYRDYGDSKSFTLSEDTNFLNAQVAVRSGVTVTNLAFYPMLRRADIEDSTYRPYSWHPLQRQLNSKNILGAKNLLKNVATTQTINGVTFTVNSDGSVTVNGTATTTATLRLIPSVFSLPAGDYILNGGYSDNIRTDKAINGANYGYSKGDDHKFTIAEGDVITYFRVAVLSGTVCDNVTVYPMVRVASDPDDTYIPYAMTNADLTSAYDGASSVTTIESNDSAVSFGTLQRFYYVKNGWCYFQFDYQITDTTAHEGAITTFPKPLPQTGMYIYFPSKKSGMSYDAAGEVRIASTNGSVRLRAGTTNTMLYVCGCYPVRE